VKAPITITLGKRSAFLAALCVFVCFGSGCGKSNGLNSQGQMSAATVIGQLQSAFKSADPLIRNDADAAVKAIQRADYPSALNALEKMRSEPHLTFEQDEIVKKATAFLRTIPADPKP